MLARKYPPCQNLKNKTSIQQIQIYTVAGSEESEEGEGFNSKPAAELRLGLFKKKVWMACQSNHKLSQTLSTL